MSCDSCAPCDVCAGGLGDEWDDTRPPCPVSSPVPMVGTRCAAPPRGVGGQAVSVLLLDRKVKNFLSPFHSLLSFAPCSPPPGVSKYLQGSAKDIGEEGEREISRGSKAAINRPIFVGTLVALNWSHAVATLPSSFASPSASR